MKKKISIKSSCCLILATLFMISSMVVASAAAPIAKSFTINCRTNGSYTFYQLIDFTSNITGSYDSIKIVGLPINGQLFLNGSPTAMSVNTPFNVAGFSSLKYYRKSGKGTSADSFTWKAISSGALSNTATVTVNTSATANDPPSVENYSIYTYSGGVQTQIISAIDDDTDPMTYTVTTAPTKGTATVDTNVVTYTNIGGLGIDTFQVTVNDGHGGSAVSTFTVYLSVLSVPTLVYNVTKFITEVPLELSGAITASTTYGSIYLSTNIEPTNGTVSYTDNTWTYTPNAEVPGSDQFLVDVTDDAGNNVVVTINIEINQKVIQSQITTTHTGNNLSLTVANTSPKWRYQFWNMRKVNSDLVDATNVDLYNWVLVQSFSASNTATFDATDATDKNGDYTMMVRIQDADGNFVEQFVDEVTPAATGDVEIGNILINGNVTVAKAMISPLFFKKTDGPIVIKINAVNATSYALNGCSSTPTENAGEFTVDISGYAPGRYTIVAQANGNGTFAKKVITLNIFEDTASESYPVISGVTATAGTLPNQICVDISSNQATGTIEFQIFWGFRRRVNLKNF